VLSPFGGAAAVDGVEMTVTNRLRLMALALVGVCLVAVLAACARAGLAGAGSVQPPQVGSSTPPTAPSLRGSRSAAPPATSGGVTRCHTGQLHVGVVGGDNAAGHIGLRVVFTNTSARTCIMYGYPGVSFLSAAGVQINDPAQRAGGPPTTVRLAPHQAAQADLLLVNVANYAGNPTCQPTLTAGVRVYPPDETVPVFVASAQQICQVNGTGVPQIYPVQTGN
jgi:hypothetical protein